MKLDDITGKRYGKLVALKNQYDPNKKVTFWECKCDCGKTVLVRANSLKHNRVKSCGCLRKESNARTKTTHGMSKTRLYTAWHTMKGRCLNENDKHYPRYGGRGIKVCEEWKESFENFKNWAIRNGYKDDLTLDRINNDGDYCPNNCRWTSQKTQNNNRGVSINITYKGKTQNLSEWCKELNIPYLRVWQRIKKYGFTFEEAITEPSHYRSGKRKER